MKKSFRTRDQQIKFLITKLPENYHTIRKHKIYLKGLDVLEEIRKGTIAETDEKIILDKMYSHDRLIYTKVNHYKKIRRALKKGGSQAVIEYLAWLKLDIIRTNKIRAKNKQVAPLDARILKLISDGASSFFKNLMMFIMSFFMAFGTANQKQSDD